MHVPRPFSERTKEIISIMSWANMQTDVLGIDQQRVSEVLTAIYRTAGMEIPDRIYVTEDPRDQDFWDAYEDCGDTMPILKARELLEQVRRRYHEIPEVDRAWAEWMRNPSRSARSGFIIPESCAVDYDFDRLILISEYEAQGYLLTQNEKHAFEIMKGYLILRMLRIGWAVEDIETNSLRLLVAPVVNLDDEGELHCSEDRPAVVWDNGEIWHHEHGIWELDNLD